MMYSRGMLIGLGIIVLFLGNATWSVYKKWGEAKENRKLDESALTALAAREKHLSAENKRLGSDRGVEEELRKRFGVAKDGEEVFIVVNPKSSDNAGGGGTKEKSLWQKLLDLF